MIILIYSETNSATIALNLGRSEYSYYFVLKEFRPVLERLGTVISIDNPEYEVDRVYHNAARHGERCIFVSFMPPHRTPIHFDCPTVCIFAWEFDTIPNEGWNGEPRNDWRVVFRKLGRAITHSTFTVNAVKAVMGQDYPIVSIPAPVWDRFDRIGHAYPAAPICAGVELSVVGTLVDSRTIDLLPYAPQFEKPGQFAKLPPESGPGDPAHVMLDGVVYCAVFNPYDDRKNWFDMVWAFGAALREATDATLVMKLTHEDRSTALHAILKDLYKIGPFKCRVVLIHGYLTDEDYAKLVGATTYTINTSRGEGQCLPVMEYMSAGRPAISPTHTSMVDYITEENAFLLESSLEAFHWPHDPRQAYRSCRHRLDYMTIVDAYTESYRVAKEDPERYARMSRQANLDLKRHCSQEVAEARLRAFIDAIPLPAANSPAEAGDPARSVA
jgi:glycosyltransferase involved in cell wall biosynthesis